MRRTGLRSVSLCLAADTAGAKPAEPSRLAGGCRPAQQLLTAW